jgi:calcium/calmodulin-dependent protein kinase I
MVGLSLGGGGAKKKETQMSFFDYYDTDDRLRSGSFGTVYTCHPRSDPTELYAVKIFDRRKLQRKDDDAVFREVAVLKELGALPHVVRLLDFYVEPNALYMVQVYAQGGDVFDRLGTRKSYNEKNARDLAKILLETIASLHDMTIVHRDLKPENLLLKDKLDDTSVLVADFGFSRHVLPDAYCTTRCGTPAFVAPEILLGTPYRFSPDLWSIGCLLYMLLGGYPPFQGPNHRALFRKVRAGDYVFHAKYFGNVSIAAKRLVGNLLTVNAKVRWTAKQALECDWFQNKTNLQLSKNDLSCCISEVLKSRPPRRWKSAVKAFGFVASAPFSSPDKATFNQQLATWDKQVQKHEASSADPAIHMNGNQDRFHKSTPHTAAAQMNVISKLPRIRFQDVYEITTKIRSGAYATVWECVHKSTLEIFAVKAIERKNLQAKDDEAILNEVAIMQSLSDNKYVVQVRAMHVLMVLLRGSTSKRLRYFFSNMFVTVARFLRRGSVLLYGHGIRTRRRCL